jgi:hypothetical protein
MQPVSLVQLAGQVVSEPLQTYGEHDAGVPLDPELLGPQVPLVVPPAAIEHASQLFEQAVSQQKPSTQLPVAHWLLAVQAVPCVSLATQLVPLQ